MTGSTLGGNKVTVQANKIISVIVLTILMCIQVRKLEFLMADALHKGCDSIITCGGIQSNHARATAVAATQLGLKPHLVLRWRGPIVSI